MQYQELLRLLQHTGKDPARLVFEDELTGLANRRFLRNFLQHKVDWEGLEQTPLALLMVDLDGFKEINDSLGHPFGDRALVWFAEQLRAVVGLDALPIRYAGDEFVVLLPGSRRSAAAELGERMLGRLQAEPFRHPDGTEVPIGFSVGVAAAPEDARDPGALIGQADTALYAAKHSGGNRVAVAGELDPDRVFAKAALQRLATPPITGRDEELQQVADAISAFSPEQSRFVLVNAGPGMGKTGFLERVAEWIGDERGPVVRVAGRPQELFRPYYLAADIIAALLAVRPAAGAALLEELSPEELQYASQVLPQLGRHDAPHECEETLQRECIFNTLLRLIGGAAGAGPLFLMVDDLHLGDEGTLNLLRVIGERRELPLFVCGTVNDVPDTTDRDSAPPLERFLEQQGDALEVERVSLGPLTPAEVDTHLRTLFPGAEIPERFERELTDLVQGNPLLLNEVARKLVLEGNVARIGQRWTVRDTAADELPRSLEEIVQAKIAALDGEDRDLLAQASAFGENVDLSVLAGTAETVEAKVSAFVDRAMELGLVSSQFEVNDESIRFISKCVLDITYGGIDPPQRERLHERAGTFQERLFQQRLLPSASILAYHFKRSANQEKSRSYEELQLTHNAFIFNRGEASRYTGEDLIEGTPLDEEGQSWIPELLRWLLMAVKNVRLYPPESEATVSARSALIQVVGEILARRPILHLHRDGTTLLVNTEPVDENELGARSAVELMGRIELRGVAFYRGVSEEELRPLLEGLAQVRPEEIDPWFWPRYAREHGLTNINLRQVRYRQIAGQEETQSARPEIIQGVGADEREALRELIRSLLGAARGIAIYPLGNRAISAAIDALLEALASLLRGRPRLILGSVADALLVNGVRVSGSDLDALARGFSEFLAAIGLSGMSFLQGVPRSEVEAFIAALPDRNEHPEDPRFWARLSEAESLSHLAFHKTLYEVREIATLVGNGVRPPQPEQPEPPELELLEKDTVEDPLELAAADDDTVDEPFTAFLEAFPAGIRDAAFLDARDELHRLIRRLFRQMGEEPAPMRERATLVCRETLAALAPGTREPFAKSLTEPLLDALRKEEDAEILRLTVALLFELVAAAIELGEHPHAARILGFLHRETGAELPPVKARALSGMLDRGLDAGSEQLLRSDLSSSEPRRREGAARVLACLGPRADASLIEVIRDCEDPRTRRLASSLLAKRPDEAAERLKRVIATEHDPVRHARVLDVLDAVTRDVIPELTCALAHHTAEVREAALRLCERMNEPELIDILVAQTRSPDVEAAACALRGLARLGATGAVDSIAAVLASTREEEVALAACQALGELGAQNAISVLGEVVAARRLIARSSVWPAAVRIAALNALSRIDDPKAREPILHATLDSDPAVRAVAESATRS